MLIGWLVRVFSVCIDLDEVPEDWQNVRLVLLYKGKGD